MIDLTTEDYTKLRLFDIIYNALSVEDLTNIAEASKIVAKLKAETIIPVGPLSKLTNELAKADSELVTLRMNYESLRVDMYNLVKLLDKGVFNSNTYNDFMNLKNRLNIYS